MATSGERTLKKIAVISTGVADLEFTVTSGFDVQTPYAASKAALNIVSHHGNQWL